MALEVVSRRLLHVNATAHPAAAWTLQQFREILAAAEHPDEYWDKTMEVNLNAQFILSREFGKEMVAPRVG